MTMTNKNYCQASTTFKKSCIGAGVEPTSRQVSKYKRGKGRAYRWMRGHFIFRQEKGESNEL